MQAPDQVGQHVRHCKTHRNAFVQDFGPGTTVVDEMKMLVYCPDSNGVELRWTTAFYKVPDSSLSVLVDEQGRLDVVTEKNGTTTKEEADFFTEETGGGPGDMWSEANWKIGRSGDATPLHF